MASRTHCSSDRRFHILTYTVCCLFCMQPQIVIFFFFIFWLWFFFLPFLVRWSMIISTVCFQPKYLHPHEYKTGLYIAFRKFWFNNKLEPGQLWFWVLNRSTYDRSYWFCQKSWAQWTGQGYVECVCQSLLQWQSKVGLALLQSHAP